MVWLVWVTTVCARSGGACSCGLMLLCAMPRVLQGCPVCTPLPPPKQMGCVRALILLHDHHETQDLEAEARTTHLVAVKADEASRYLEFMTERAWRKADFTRFSRRTNPSADELSLSSLMNR